MNLATVPLLVIATHAAVEQPPDPAIDFRTDVLPILQTFCHQCHYGLRTKGRLGLDSREAMLKGGRSGPAIIPGDPDGSLLIQRVTTRDPQDMMPPKDGPLWKVEIDILREWIRQGAPWPEDPDDQR
ncbi:MAG: hypothetical protein CMJ32_06040 [Phycisphaerae bacterium]|nr:hypothetical protein [Phycisphaerae bacterium]